MFAVIVAPPPGTSREAAGTTGDIPLGTTGQLYYGHHIAGCALVTIAVSAMGEVTRAVRFLNIPVGAWVALSPYVLGSHDLVDQVGAAVLGILAIGLSLPRGKRSEEQYGSWNHLIV